MAEPKKPSGGAAGGTATQGPEEPTQYLEQQPMGEGAEGDGGHSYDYGPAIEEVDEESLGGHDFESYTQVEE